MILPRWEPAVREEPRPGAAKPWFIGAVAFLAPVYMRAALRIRSVKVEGARVLARLYDEALRGESRFLVAFRHPGDADPHLAFWLLHVGLPRELRRPRKDFGARFVSGDEIALWGGPLVRWALRNAGTVPVRHGYLDRPTMDALVAAIAESPAPLALAPEGQITYHAGSVPALDEGSARLALWAGERLAATGRPLPIHIVPLAVEYRFTAAARARLPAFLSRLERRCGLADGGSDSPRARIERIWDRIVGLAEDHYARVYGQEPAPRGSGIRERLVQLLEGSIARLEAFYGLVPGAGAGSGLKARTMAARSAAMARVFYDRSRWAAMSPLERGMARKAAAEAFFIDRHQQLVDLGEYLDPAYAGPEGLQTPPDRLIELAQNLWDLAQRLEGGDVSTRTGAFSKDVVLRVGTPVEAALQDGEKSRSAARRITEGLRAGFAALAGPAAAD